MPLNLSALIRYKTINNCLSGIRKYTMAELVDRCSEALSDYKGSPTSISERTVREDIKIMRSDILGLNAPIEQKEGYYYYGDRNYDLMNVFIKEQGLAIDLIELLVDLNMKVDHPKIIELIRRLKTVTGESEKYFDIKEKEHGIINHSISYDKIEPEPIFKSINQKVHKTSKPKKKSIAREKEIIYTGIKITKVSLKEVFDLLKSLPDLTF